MPVTAWIDERHLGPLGLTNAWGYNPVSFMALDPRIAPGGIGRTARDGGWRCAKPASASSSTSSSTTRARATNSGRRCRCAGSTTKLIIATRRMILESWSTTPAPATRLACDRPVVRGTGPRLRCGISFAYAGVDGFRFDLAPILGRNDRGLRPRRALLQGDREDPVLKDRDDRRAVDIGPGRAISSAISRPPFLEWNDRFRDDIRRFWRARTAAWSARSATRLAGSSAMFKRRRDAHCEFPRRA